MNKKPSTKVNSVIKTNKMGSTEKTIKKTIDKHVNNITPAKLAIREKIELIFIGVLSILLIFTVLFVFVVFGAAKSQQEFMYRSYYYIYSDVKNKTAISTDERKQKFQMKIMGLMKKFKTDLTDEELCNFTSYVFDKSEEYEWNPYLAISFAKVESNFKKNALGTSDDKGMFQFISSTAKLISGDKYYNNIEFNVLDSTKMWFKYFKVLLDYFDGNLQYAILAYNVGEKRVIKLAGLKKNNNNLWDFKKAKLDKLRSVVYDKKNIKYYDAKILESIEYIKTYNGR